jgi:hypothetical protein
VNTIEIIPTVDGGMFIKRYGPDNVTVRVNNIDISGRDIAGHDPRDDSWSRNAWIYVRATETGAIIK